MYHFSNEGKTCFPLKEITGGRKKDSYKDKDKVSSNQSNKKVQDKTAFAFMHAFKEKFFFSSEFQFSLLEPKLVIVNISYIILKNNSPTAPF